MQKQRQVSSHPQEQGKSTLGVQKTIDQPKKNKDEANPFKRLSADECLRKLEMIRCKDDSFKNEGSIQTPVLCLQGEASISNITTNIIRGVGPTSPSISNITN